MSKSAPAGGVASLPSGGRKGKLVRDGSSRGLFCVDTEYCRIDKGSLMEKVLCPPYTNHYVTAALRLYCLRVLIHLKVGRARQSEGADMTKIYLWWCSPLVTTGMQDQCMEFIRYFTGKF